MSTFSEKQASREATSTKTGHVLLDEGGASVVTLSKRGLFVAGKVMHVHIDTDC